MKNNHNTKYGADYLKTLVTGVGLVCLLTVSSSFAQSKNELLTKAAWEAYNSNLFVLAISNATECVDGFEDTAKTQQSTVESSGKKPPIGKPKNEAERLETQERGPLNDVATCWFIRGESYLKLSKSPNPDKPDKEALKKARDAYKETLWYSHGRSWDTNGFFWSPAQEARGRLTRVERLLSVSGDGK